jgi:hypothetical protein
VLLVAGIIGLKAARDRALLASLPRTTQLRGPFTARQGIAEATRIAKLWDQDCFLEGIQDAFLGDLPRKSPGLTFDGVSIPPSGWLYRFLSPGRVEFLDLILAADGRCEIEARSAINYPDAQPLPTEFLDSTEALRIAEESFGRDFRQNGRVFGVDAAIVTSAPHRTTWHIEYLGPESRPRRVDLHLLLDAISGKVLTVQEEDGASVRTIYKAVAE